MTASASRRQPTSPIRSLSTAATSCANGNLNLAFDANRGITLGTAGGGFDSPSTSSVTWNGIITGTLGGDLKISGAGSSNSGKVLLTNTGNNYDGNTVLSQNGTTLILGASEVIPDTSVLSMTATGTLDMNGFNETVKALSSTVSSGTIQLGSNTLTLDNPTGESAGTKIVGDGTVIKNGSGARFSVPQTPLLPANLS